MISFSVPISTDTHFHAIELDKGRKVRQSMRGMSLEVPRGHRAIGRVPNTLDWDSSISANCPTISGDAEWVTMGN